MVPMSTHAHASLTSDTRHAACSSLVCLGRGGSRRPTSSARDGLRHRPLPGARLRVRARGGPRQQALLRRRPSRGVAGEALDGADGRRSRDLRLARPAPRRSAALGACAGAPRARRGAHGTRAAASAGRALRYRASCPLGSPRSDPRPVEFPDSRGRSRAFGDFPIALLFQALLLSSRGCGGSAPALPFGGTTALELVG